MKYFFVMFCIYVFSNNLYAEDNIDQLHYVGGQCTYSCVGDDNQYIVNGSTGPVECLGYALIGCGGESNISSINYFYHSRITPEK